MPENKGNKTKKAIKKTQDDKDVIEKPKDVVEKPKVIITKSKGVIKYPKEVVKKPKEVIKKPKEVIKKSKDVQDVEIVKDDKDVEVQDIEEVQNVEDVGNVEDVKELIVLQKNTLIPLFNGDIKRIEDIEIGDQLIGDDGSVRNVIDKRIEDRKLFEITQHCYQGQSYVVSEDHIMCLRLLDHKVIFWSDTENTWNMLWLDQQMREIKKKLIRVYEKEEILCNKCGTELKSSISRHYSRKHPGIEIPARPRKSPTMISPDTPEVKEGYAKMEEFAATISDDNTLDISIGDYMKLNKTTKGRLSGYIGKCVQWEPKDVELDPYVLGLWLGDGYHSGMKFAINVDADPEILEYLQAWGLENDAKFKQSGKNIYYYSVSSLSGCRVAPLKKQLSVYNLVKNKHIPKEYLVNSRDVRLKILAGMIDTDGHVSREGTRISIAQGMNHKQLSEDIIFLSRSLGFKCTAHVCKTQWRYEGVLKKGLAIMINISGEGVEDIPTRVARKKCSPPFARDTTGTGYLTIKEIDEGSFIDLAVDGNQRFVLGNFTVVHN